MNISPISPEKPLDRSLMQQHFVLPYMRRYNNIKRITMQSFVIVQFLYRANGQYYAIPTT